MPSTAPTSPNTRPRSTGPTAKANGISFAFIKATEGGDRVDDHFDEHWRVPEPPACRAAPIISTISAARPRSRRAGSSTMCRATARRCRRCSTWNGTRNRRPASCRPAAATVRSEMRTFLDNGRKPLRQEADHLHLGRLLRRQRPVDLPRLSVLAALGRRPSDREIRQPSLHLLAIHRHRRCSRASGAMPTSMSSTAAKAAWKKWLKATNITLKPRRILQGRLLFATGSGHGGTPVLSLRRTETEP